MGYSAKQRKIKVGVLGVDKIKRTLKAMDEAAGGVLEKGAQARGEIALYYAKQNTPVDTGALRNSLKLTTDKVTKKKATVKIDYDSSLRYGAFVELGARGRAAQPFMRGSVDNNQKKINTTIVSKIVKVLGGKM